MARSFNGTTEGIGFPNNGIDVQTQLAITAWVNPAAAPASGSQFTVVANGRSAGNRNFVLDYRNISGTLQLEVSNSVGASFGEMRAVTTLSTGVWHSIVFSVDWTLNPWTGTCFVDGSSVTVTNSGAVTTGTPSTADTIQQIGEIASVAFWNGNLSEIAVRKGVLLTANEAKAHNAGERPSRIRPTSIVGWWPIDGLQSPEPEYSGNKMVGTLTGTAFATGPPLMPLTPRWPFVENFIPPSILLAGGAGTTIFRPRMVDGWRWRKTTKRPKLLRAESG